MQAECYSRIRQNKPCLDAQQKPYAKDSYVGKLAAAAEQEFWKKNPRKENAEWTITEDEKVKAALN
jgi:hypothetical protein